MCMHSSSGNNWKQTGRLHSCKLLLGLGDVANIAMCCCFIADILILLTQQALLPPVFDGCFQTPADLACILYAPWVDIALNMHIRHQIQHADAVIIFGTCHLYVIKSTHSACAAC